MIIITWTEKIDKQGDSSVQILKIFWQKNIVIEYSGSKENFFVIHQSVHVCGEARSFAWHSSKTGKMALKFDP